MDVEVAGWLVSEAAAPWLEKAFGFPDPASLGAATSMRKSLPADRAVAVLDQAALWRRAIALGRAGHRAERAPGLRFLTGAGLEQATRPEVAAWRAGRIAAAGVSTVVDVGCGLGMDALAMSAAGVEVLPVERDPAVAVLAEANLGVPVRVGDAEDLAPELLHGGRGVFCDPARRTGRGRSWDLADLSPSWPFVLDLLDGTHTACVKLGPGVPHRVLPPGIEVTWVSHRGDAVEATLWAGPGSRPGLRSAVVLPAGAELEVGPPVPEAGEVGRWLVEPDPAVIRSGAVGALVARAGLHPLADQVAYLAGEASRPEVEPYGTVFEVLDTLPYDIRALSAWVRREQIGTLEIKRRGLEVDPATLRRQLKPRGSASATLILTPTAHGARALVAVRRAPLPPASKTEVKA